MKFVRNKVLFLVPSLAGGGAERVFTTLLRNLDRNRFELHLGVLEAAGCLSGEIPDDVNVHVLNVPRVRYALPGVVRLVRKVRPGAVLSTLGHLNQLLIMAKPLLPRETRLIVREAVNSAGYLSERQNPRFTRWLHRRLYKRADRVVCLSDFLLEDMVEAFDVPRHKVVRIYNPVDIRRVRHLAGQSPDPYPDKGLRLVAAGRLTRQKGFDVLLDALPAVKDRFPEVRLTILGEGPLRSELMDQSRRLSLSAHVDFAGFQPNPWNYFQYADLFVFPSRFEGMPNVLLEALALGIPAVAADCPGGVAEIKECDDQLLLVPVEDPRALAEAIIAACIRPKRSPETLEQVENRMKKFSLQRLVEDYSQLF